MMILLLATLCTLETQQADVGDSTEISLGVVSAPDREIVVTLVNDGCEDWVFDRSIVSCPACLSIVEAPRFVPAGGRQDVRLQIRPRSTPGPQQWGAAFLSRSHPPTRILMGGVVPGLEARLSDGMASSRAAGRSHDVLVRWHGEGELASARWASVSSGEKHGSFDLLSDGLWGARIGIGHSERSNTPRAIIVTAIVHRQDGAEAAHQIQVPIRLCSERSDVSSVKRLFLGRVRPGEAGEVVVSVPRGARVATGLSMRSIALHPRLASTPVGERVMHLQWKCDLDAEGVLRGRVVVRDRAGQELKPAIEVLAFARAEEAS